MNNRSKKLISKQEEMEIISSVIKDSQILEQLKKRNLGSIKAFLRIDPSSFYFMTASAREDIFDIPKTRANFEANIKNVEKWQKTVAMNYDIAQVKRLYPKLQIPEVIKLKQGLADILKSILANENIRTLLETKNHDDMMLEAIKALHLSCKELSDKIMHLWWDFREVQLALPTAECFSPLESLELSDDHDLQTKLLWPEGIKPPDIVNSAKEFLNLTNTELKTKYIPQTVDLQKAWETEQLCIDPCFLILGKASPASWPIKWFCTKISNKQDIIV